jgi:hypothetical protein
MRAPRCSGMGPTRLWTMHAAAVPTFDDQARCGHSLLK